MAKTRDVPFFSSLFVTLVIIIFPYSILAREINEGLTSSETIQQKETPPTNSGENTPHIHNTIEGAHSIETLWFSSEEEVTIATRHVTPISKAPGIVTVITAEEIKHLGYRSFAEILRTVPGFEILKTGDFGVVMPAVRGLTSTFGNKVRVMVNGHMINHAVTGDAFFVFDDFPVENIKRLEIIRGPGSAIYGENAFLAVINIITKDADDISGIRVSGGYGSFDTHEENILFGDTWGKVKLYGMVRYRSTDGFDGTVNSDYQTILDNTFGSSASQTPGKVHDARREYNLNLNVSYEDVWFQGWYTNKHKEPFIGPNFALVDEADLETSQVFGEIGYKKTFDGRLTLRPRAYYDYYYSNIESETLPEGTTFPNINNMLETHPDGLIAVVIGVVNAVGTEIPIDFKLFDGNIITLGLEYRIIDLTRNNNLANYDPITFEDLGSVQELPGVKIPEVTRRVWSMYLQDVWDITDTLNLTLGVRHDRYNDFGEATSPRCGLTWSFIKNASLKLLYGEAFRAPTFNEMFTRGQSALQGNEDLDPETIRTYEIGLSYRFNRNIATSVNYFYNDIKDLIVLRSLESNPNIRRFDNFGNAHVQGIEMETRVDIIKDSYIFMNYTFQNPEDNHGNDLPFVAEHYGNFGVNVHYPKYINTNISTFVSGPRSREADDTRDDLPAYALVNLSIIGKNFFKTMEVQGTVFNLFDKDYSDPAPIIVPDDLPRPGRTFFVGLSYQF